jgi:simple sugar transport system ATP-binding protein
MQKLMLARELSDNPRVIIAMQPTWGLDVGATLYVRETLLAQRDRGAAVLLVSDDLEEIFSVSDRIAVIYGGKLTGVIDDTDAVTEEEMGLMMAGTTLGRYSPEAALKSVPEDD